MAAVAAFPPDAISTHLSNQPNSDDTTPTQGCHGCRPTHIVPRELAGSFFRAAPPEALRNCSRGGGPPAPLEEAPPRAPPCSEANDAPACLLACKLARRGLARLETVGTVRGAVGAVGSGRSGGRGPIRRQRRRRARALLSVGRVERGEGASFGRHETYYRTLAAEHPEALARKVWVWLGWFARVYADRMCRVASGLLGCGGYGARVCVAGMALGCCRQYLSRRVLWVCPNRFTRKSTYEFSWKRTRFKLVKLLLPLANPLAIFRVFRSFSMPSGRLCIAHRFGCGFTVVFMR
eukprot:242112-Prorocentrum_minimum.AAC.1